MVETQFEAILASPPDRDELVVQLFAKDGGQWGEVYRDEGEYWIDLYCFGAVPIRSKLDAMMRLLTRSQGELSERLNGQ